MMATDHRKLEKLLREFHAVDSENLEKMIRFMLSEIDDAVRDVVIYELSCVYVTKRGKLFTSVDGEVSELDVRIAYYKEFQSVEDSLSTVAPKTEVVRYGKPEINEVFEIWRRETGLEISSKIQTNRRAASNLLKKFGVKKLTQLIRGVALAQNDQYAPRIANFIDLQAKLDQLLLWGKKRQSKTLILGGRE